MAVQTPPAPTDPTQPNSTRLVIAQPFTDDVEAGVVDDARARQRRQRRAGGALLTALAAGIAALVLAFGGGGGHGGAGAHSGGGGSAPAPGSTQGDSEEASAVSEVPGGFWSMGLLAPGVGWVINSSGLHVTHDGGRTWSELRTRPLAGGGGPAVLASTSPSPPALMVSNVDAQSVYARCPEPAASGSAASALPAGRTVVSRDSGRTWRSSTFPKCLTPASLSFVNARDGFTLGHFDRKGFPTPMLYMTTTGGRKWKRVGRPPFEGTISFANARDGLGGGWGIAEGPVDSGAIDRTTDGGRSWTQTSLCQPATVYECEAPKLFPSGRGVVAVTVHREQPQSSAVEIFTTRSFGVSWTPHVIPNTPTLEQPEYVPFSAPNPNDLFAWITPYLYRSTDGGIKWSRFAEPALTGQQGLSGIDFVNANYGWFDDNTFEYTSDGGRHWSPLGSADHG